MTKFQRIRNVLIGLGMIALSALLFAPVEGLLIVATILSLTLSIRGIGYISYYLRMARHMVGGKAMLYRGILFLDAGVMTGTITDNSIYYIVMYLAFIHLFAGVIDILRTLEARSVRSPIWRTRAAYGITNIILAIIVIVGGAVQHSVTTVVYVYAAGLAYSGILRIISAFRKTAIVYIQ